MGGTMNDAKVTKKETTEESFLNEDHLKYRENSHIDVDAIEKEEENQEEAAANYDIK